MGPKEKILLYIIFYALGAREQCAKLLRVVMVAELSDVRCDRGGEADVSRPGRGPNL